MVDAVGDGHADYPLNITAYYLWKGYDPDFAAGEWDNLGGPLITVDPSWTLNNADTAGRLAGAYFDGEMPLYAPNSSSDPSLDRMVQPHAIGFMDQDENLTAGAALSNRYAPRSLRSGRLSPPGGEWRARRKCNAEGGPAALSCFRVESPKSAGVLPAWTIFIRSQGRFARVGHFVFSWVESLRLEEKRSIVSMRFYVAKRFRKAQTLII